MFTYDCLKDSLMTALEPTLRTEVEVDESGSFILLQLINVSAVYRSLFMMLQYITL